MFIKIYQKIQIYIYIYIYFKSIYMYIYYVSWNFFVLIIISRMSWFPSLQIVSKRNYNPRPAFTKLFYVFFIQELIFLNCLSN